MKGDTFTWKIESFPALMVETEQLKSDTFVMFGHEWNIWLHTKSSQGSHLGLFLSVANPSCLPAGWNISAGFYIAVVHRFDNSKTLRNYSTPECCFDEQTTKRGWDEFVLLRKLYGTPGFLVNGTLTVEAQITVKTNVSATKSPFQDFPALLHSISNRVVPSSSALPSQWPHSSGPRAQKSGLGSNICSALPLALASGLHGFCSQFKELSEAYASNLAVLNATQSFFESKDDTLSSLKKMDNARMKIKKSMDEVSKEIEDLERRLGEQKDAKSRLLQEYAAIGKKSERLKVEWDEIAAKIGEMTEDREKAKKELAKIEDKLNNFIPVLYYQT